MLVLRTLFLSCALALAACAEPAPRDEMADVSAPRIVEDDAGNDHERPCAERWGEAPSTEPHWIAFDELGEVRMIDVADPNSEPQVVHTSAPDEIPSTLEPGWSADGRWFAFRTSIDDGWRLYAVEVVNGELSAARPILEAQSGSPWFDDFRWSPRGAWLSYLEHDGGDESRRSKLMLHDMDAEAPVTALEGINLSGARWAPDATMLSLVDGDSSMRLLIRIDDTGSTSTHALGVDEASRPSWSPDGRFLVSFEIALIVYDTASEPVRITKLGEPDGISGITWSDDGRFFVLQRNADLLEDDYDGILLEAYDAHDLEAEPRRVEVASPHGETPFSIGDDQALHPPDVAFVPGDHAIVTALDEGWTYVPLRDARGESRVVAPLEAGIVGFGAARELLSIDARGIHATPLDGGAKRMLFELNDPLVRDEHSWFFGQNTLVGPARDRLAVARPDRSSAFDLVLLEGCEPEHVALELPYRWSGVFVPGFHWAWLSDGRSLLQQTESIDGSQPLESSDEALATRTARLELARIVAGRVELRTLLEAPAALQSLPFEWREQPR